MESEIFDFEALDGNVEVMSYYDVTLKVQVYEFPIGTKFDIATINSDTGHLSLYRKDASCEMLMGRYQLKMQITADLLAD